MLPAWLMPHQQKLQLLIAKQLLAHGIMFTGVEGVGKGLLADWLAASLLCTSTQLRPCNGCKSCLLRIAGNHSDFLIIDASGSSIGVDAVRQLSLFMQGRAQQQSQGTKEPSHGSKRKVIRPQTIVEGLRRSAHQVTGTLCEVLPVKPLIGEFLRRGHRADDQGDKGVLAHGPGKAEEGIHEDAHQHQNFELKHQHGRRLRERDLTHQFGRLVGGPQQGKQTADDDDAG